MDLSRYTPVFGGADSVRFAYLRLPVLQRALEDDRILDALVKQLEVPGKAAVLKALSRDEKLRAIEHQIDHYRSAKTSVWHDVPPAEVLAATMFRASLPDKIVFQLFGNVKSESALLRPVSAWLKAKSLTAFDEVPMGLSRVDVLGHRKGGWLTSSEFIAVELKDEFNQMKRGLDQMTTYGEYAHKVYLACTPYLAADYLDRHADGVKVKHWDPRLLDRKLEQFGFGLLLVEGDSVFEYREPTPREPHAKKVAEVELALQVKRPL